MGFYLLIGKKENWKVSLEQKLWGFTQKNIKQWQRMEKNDLLAFYVTLPIRSVVGFGIVEKRFHDAKLTWPQEIWLEESIWPYKISFKVLCQCNDWEDGIEIPKTIILQTSSKRIDQDLFMQMVENADKKWDTCVKNFLPVDDR